MAFNSETKLVDAENEKSNLLIKNAASFLKDSLA